MTEPLAPARLRAVCDPDRLGFRSTAELEPLSGVLGQERALRAIDFGIGMKVPGYNLFVAGPAATGKTSTMQAVLRRTAKGALVPPDYCYLYNFEDPYRPRAIELPAGQGRALRDGMARLVEACRERLPRAFEEADFGQKEAGIEERLKQAGHSTLAEIEQLARQEGFTVLRSPETMTVVYAPKGTPLDVEAYAALPAQERDRIEALAAGIEARVDPAMRQIRQLEREAQLEHEKLVSEAVARVTAELLLELRQRFKEVPAVQAQLAEIERDLVAHAEMLRADPEDPKSAAEVTDFLDRYLVNVLVDRSSTEGTPVVTEENPTYRNLVGRFEHRIEQGALVTSFLLIKAGALLQANGGYLLLEAKDLLQDPVAWDALKRALKSRSLRMEEPIEEFRLLSAASLQPEPIPLSVKVVLLGTPSMYQLLYEVDEDFRELFKVKVEFEESLPRTPESERALGRFVAGAVQEHGLRALSAAAVAALVEEGSRQVAHQGRYSARFGEIVDLLREADFWAAQRGRGLIEAEDLRFAIAQKIDRQSMIEEHLARATQEQLVHLCTAGTAIGQINGVAVLQSGGHMFGRPLRITARARPAERPGVVDVEREVGLGGPIHSKGVLVLGGYLAGRYAPGRPLRMSASIVAEQSYDQVEGDSASLAELCALLSVLGDAPLRQDLAVTGSLDQHGQVQAVGGVSQKIEGFFDLLRSREQSGGVIIPEANVQSLMLREDLVRAAKGGRFSVYAVRTVDQAVSILSGRTAGVVDAAGRFPDDSLNAAIERKLLSWATL